jgi:hypothetical protein
MMKRQIGTAVLVLLCAAAATPVAAAVTAAPGYAVRSIPTPGLVGGGVVRRGEQIFIGQGPTFTAGGQSVVRLVEGGAATTVASGFNSLGGFDLAPDGALYVVDNGLEAPGATSGDTVYAVPEALTRVAAAPAASVELLPSGSLDAAYDVLVVPGAVLVSDAVGPGAGRVVQLKDGAPTDLIAGLDYTAGLALDGPRLLVGNLSGSFVGSVQRYDLAGVAQGALVDGLSGNYAHVVDGDGEVLVTGGFTDDLSSSTVVAVDGAGAVRERARGFGFSGELFHDLVRDETLVLDFGVSEIAAICRDADGNATCDADEPCAVSATRAKLGVGKLGAELGDETLRFTGEIALAPPVGPGLDPGRRGVRLRLETATGAVVHTTVPPGTGWKVNKAGTVWTFTSKTGVGSLGVTKVTLKTSAKAPGVVKFAVKAGGTSLTLEEADLPLQSTLALDASGRCGAARFAGEDAVCRFNRKRTAVRCG